MNILVFSWRDPKHPMAGGAEQVMHEHMKGWVESGHSVTFFSSSFKGSKKVETIDGVKIIRGGNQILGVQITGFIWYLFSKHPKYDLVVDEFHGLPFFTPVFVRVKKLAVIQEVAREVWFLNHLIFPINKIIGLIGYLSEPLIFLFYRKNFWPWSKDVVFMTGSESAKKDIISMGIKADNIHIVPHGVLLKHIAPRKLPKKTIVFLGALARDKGIEDAIDAFSILNKKGDFNFWVIGGVSKGYDEFLYSNVKELGLTKKVKFWGFVSEEKKFELLSKAHVLVNPSIREGWGLVNIEANSEGLPVVAYNSPGLVDSVKDGVSGVICKENTPESMSEEILSLLNEDKKYQRLSEGAKRWSGRFSWQASRKISLTLIDKVARLN